MSTQAIQLSSQALRSLTLWTEADIAHVKEMIAPQANEQEFRLLIYMANKYQLDPLLKQIWCVKYGDKPAQIFAGRDGFLAIAHRGGAFDGLETTIRIEQVPLDIAFKDYGKPARFTREYQYVATARAYMKGAGHPVMVEVWEEEYSTGQNLWATKPRTMITKVAECQAVRKAFNISGLYEPSEMPEQEGGMIDATAYEIRETQAPSDRPPAPASASARPPARESAQGRTAPAPPAAERPLRAATGDTHETAPAQASGDPLQQAKARVKALAHEWGWGLPELEAVFAAHVIAGVALGQASRAQMEALEAVMRAKGVAALPSLAAVGTP